MSQIQTTRHSVNAECRAPVGRLVMFSILLCFAGEDTSGGLKCDIITST
jgi:hypothetical protein